MEGRPSATRPSTGTSTGLRAARTASSATCRRPGGGAAPATAASRAPPRSRASAGSRTGPAEVGTRETFGHWEGDLLIFGKQAGKADVTSLVERTSRFTFL